MSVYQAVNATVDIPYYHMGTQDPVVVTATKINQTQRSTVLLQLCTPEGCCVIVDPVITQLSIPATEERGRIGRVTETFTDIPQIEKYITVQNGSPGLKRLLVMVNDKGFRQFSLKSNTTFTINAESSMREGNNTITLVGFGHPGDEALVIISDVPAGDEEAGLRPLPERPLAGITNTLNRLLGTWPSAEREGVQGRVRWQPGRNPGGRNMTWGR